MWARCTLCSVLVLSCKASGGSAAGDDLVLQQEQLTHVRDLVMQRQRATAAQQREAARWVSGGSEDAQQRRWDRAAKAFGEAAIRYPTFSALRGLGESLARSDRSRDTPEESLRAQHAALQSGLASLKVAIEFVSVTRDEVPEADRVAVSGEIACIESYLAQPTREPTCELVRSAMVRNKRRTMAPSSAPEDIER